MRAAARSGRVAAMFSLVGADQCQDEKRGVGPEHEHRPGSVWARWIHRPRTLWLRKVAFHVHLWTGVALSAYVIVLSLTGSALVYRRELQRALDTPRPTFDPAARRLSRDELSAAAARAFPGHAVGHIDTEITRRDPAIQIRLEREGEKLTRLFDPYTGEDLGDSFPGGIRAIIWLASLHDELLLGREHR